MVVIGLCGGSGSGKTTAAAIMASLGAAVIETDRVYHEMCAAGTPCMEELAAEFGDHVAFVDGRLDRSRLSRYVFANEDARLRLNEITHAHIKRETLALIEKYRAGNYPAVVVDAPLLFEAGFDRFCDLTVGVTSPREVRIARITARDGVSPDAAEARIAPQIGDEELRARCDYIIENNGDTAELEVRVVSFYKSAVFGE